MLTNLDLSKLTLEELLLLLDAVCSTAELRQLLLMVRLYRCCRQQPAGHRRTLYPQMAAHRRVLVTEVQP